MDEKPIVWLRGEVKSPPFSVKARIEAGQYLGQLQQGQSLSMPISRAMPSISPRCHELRINDTNNNWRVIYCTEPNAILILEVFAKKTKTTPNDVIASCQRRLAKYQEAVLKKD